MGLRSKSILKQNLSPNQLIVEMMTRLTCPPASTRYSLDTVLIRGEPSSRPRPADQNQIRIANYHDCYLCVGQCNANHDKISVCPKTPSQRFKVCLIIKRVCKVATLKKRHRFKFDKVLTFMGSAWQQIHGKSADHIIHPPTTSIFKIQPFQVSCLVYVCHSHLDNFKKLEGTYQLYFVKCPRYGDPKNAEIYSRKANTIKFENNQLFICQTVTVTV